MYNITRIAPHQTALTSALVVTVLTVIAFMPMILFTGFGMRPEGMGMGFPLGMMLFMPLVQFITAYIAVAIGALLYNLVARYTGGFRIELSRNEQHQHETQPE
jgi:uncharacterized membrane protein